MTKAEFFRLLSKEIVFLPSIRFLSVSAHVSGFVWRQQTFIRLNYAYDKTGAGYKCIHIARTRCPVKTDQLVKQYESWLAEFNLGLLAENNE